MTTEFSDQVRDLFHELIELPEGQRSERLDQRAPTPEVRAEVERLLGYARGADRSAPGAALSDPERAVKEVADAFVRALEQGVEAGSAVRSLSDEAQQALAMLADASTAGGLAEVASLDERLEGWSAPQDRYESEGMVGSGGMGQILRIWDRQLDRPLAMKILHRSRAATGGSRSLARRFVDEARTTGRLEHPGVVPVHEMGVDENGQAYFTMRLVKGLTFLEVIARVARGEDGWTRTRALEALVRACETVAFAHARRVIHRDLKPANIMVGSFGETYVMDWGLAKELDRAEVPGDLATLPGDDADSRDPLRQTIAGEVLGTPAYMPPEQARGELAKVGAASDVYAMGCVLYHLLAGHAPYGESPASVKVVLQRVREEPPLPLERRTDAPPELVAICEKAMSRQIGDRYPDMQAMRDDLRRYLEGRVVQAHRTGAWIELRKWVSRNRGLAAASALALVLALGGLGTTSYVQARANRDLRAARNATQAANAELSTANENLGRVVDFQSQQLAGIDVPLLGQGIRSALLRGVATEDRGEVEEWTSSVNFTDLARGALRDHILKPSIQSIDRQFPEQVLVRAELLHSVAESALVLRLLEFAWEPQQKALELRRAELGEDDPTTLDSLRISGELLHQQGDYLQAEEVLRDAIERRSRIEGEDSPAVLGLRTRRGTTLVDLNLLKEADDVLERVVARCRSTLGGDDERSLRAIARLGRLRFRQNRFPEALELFQEVQAGRRRAYGDAHPTTLEAMSNIGQALQQMGRLAEAEEMLRQTVAGTREAYGRDHPQTQSVLGGLASVLESRGELREAERLRREALEASIRTLGRDHPQTLLCINNLALCLDQLGEIFLAEGMYRRAYEGSRRSLGERHIQTLKAKGNWATTLWEVKRLEESESLRRELIEDFLAAGDEATHFAEMSNLSLLLRDLGQVEEAEELAWRAYEGRRRVLGERHSSTLNSLHNVASLLVTTGRLDEAEPYCLRAVQEYREIMGDLHVGTLYSLKVLAELREKQGNWELAEAALREAVEGWRQVTGLSNPNSKAVFDAWLNSIRILQLFDEGEEVLFELWDEAEEAAEHPEQENAYQRWIRVRLVELYRAWHHAEPGEGYDEKAALWE